MATLTAPSGSVVTVSDELADRLVEKGYKREKAEKSAPKSSKSSK